MAAEPRRGCGYRQIEGIYLEGDPGGFPCGRMPLALRPCPLCDHEPAFTRGLQRIRPKNILHAANECRRPPAECDRCPLGKALEHEQAGLIWVGERYYTPASFTAEAATLGVSRRIGDLPGWLELGYTWVFCAHRKVFSEPCPFCQGDPTPLEKVAKGRKQPDPEDCEGCDGEGVIWTPGVFHAFIPRRLVQILPDKASPERVARVKEAGFTVVQVPHNDPDHQ